MRQPGPALLFHAGMASAYCWQQGADGNFVTLVYSYASRYVNLRYPQGGAAD